MDAERFGCSRRVFPQAPRVEWSADTNLTTVSWLRGRDQRSDTNHEDGQTDDADDGVLGPNRLGFIIAGFADESVEDGTADEQALWTVEVRDKHARQHVLHLSNVGTPLYIRLAVLYASVRSLAGDRSTFSPATEFLVCPPGTHDVRGRCKTCPSCRSCPLHTYMPVYNSKLYECTPCPWDSPRTLSVGSVGSDLCLPCPEGTYGPQCLPCPGGRPVTNGALGNSSAICRPCPRNTFGISSCTPCPEDRPLTLANVSLTEAACVAAPTKSPTSRPTASPTPQRPVWRFYSSGTSLNLPCPDHAICPPHATVEDIIPEPGYWRTDNRSTIMLECPVPSLCENPVYADALAAQEAVEPFPKRANVSQSGSCEAPYRGAFCMRCEPGYAMNKEWKCVVCSAETTQAHEATKRDTIIALVVSLVVVVGAGAATRCVSLTRPGVARDYPVGDEEDADEDQDEVTSNPVAPPAAVSSAAQGKSSSTFPFAFVSKPSSIQLKHQLQSRRRKTAGCLRTSWHQFEKYLYVKVRIVLSFFQVSIATASALSASPRLYQEFARVFNFVLLNFGDSTQLPDLYCAEEFNHMDKMFVLTISPIVVLAAVWVEFGAAWFWCTLTERHDAARVLLGDMMALSIFVMFLVFPLVTASIYKTFSCHELPDGSFWLRTDFTVSCDTASYRDWAVYAACMAVLYTLGIPFVFWLALRRGEPRISRKLSRGYQLPEYRMYELYELFRKLVQASLIAFMFPGQLSQYASGLLLVLVFVTVLAFERPYKLRNDHLLAIASQLALGLMIGVLLGYQEGSSNATATTAGAMIGISVVVVLLGGMAAAWDMYFGRAHGASGKQAPALSSAGVQSTSEGLTGVADVGTGTRTREDGGQSPPAAESEERREPVSAPPVELGVL